MNKEQKFKIILEGLQNGISITCNKYGISRTIYYRWLNKYKTIGINGLDPNKKNFIPKNKTSPLIENKILELIRSYPNYGPRALKYLLEELDIQISESAVYNILKRNNLTNKNKRIKYLNRKINNELRLPNFNSIKSGELWLSWINDCGSFENIGQIYQYTIFDYKSKIACSRLYSEITIDNYIDLLTAVAIPITNNLKLETNYICFFENIKLAKHTKLLNEKIIETTKDYGFSFNLLTINDEINELVVLKEKYTNESLSYLISKINNNINFEQLKYLFQDYIKNYNLKNKIHYPEGSFSPIEYHNFLTNTRLILPIWAYSYRNY